MMEVNYEDSGVNKEFDPTAVTWKEGYLLNEYFAVEARAGMGVDNDTKQNLITDDGLGLTSATVELNTLPMYLNVQLLPISQQRQTVACQGGV